MSSEGRRAAVNFGPASALPGKSATQSEKQLRAREVALERDIMATRAQGTNVSQATHEKWLGSMALKKGDKIDAMQHFDRAAKHLALARAGDSSTSRSRTSLHANETNQPDGATNMHSNRSSTSVY
jgi:hypothetical protein